MNNGKRKVVLSPPSTQHSFKCLSPILSKNARKISKEKGILHLSNVKSTESSDGLPNFSTILKTNVRDFTLQDPVIYFLMLTESWGPDPVSLTFQD